MSIDGDIIKSNSFVICSSAFFSLNIQSKRGRERNKQKNNLISAKIICIFFLWTTIVLKSKHIQSFTSPYHFAFTLEVFLNEHTTRTSTSTRKKRLKEEFFCSVSSSTAAWKREKLWVSHLVWRCVARRELLSCHISSSSAQHPGSLHHPQT